MDAKSGKTGERPEVGGRRPEAAQACGEEPDAGADVCDLRCQRGGTCARLVCTGARGLEHEVSRGGAEAQCEKVKLLPCPFCGGEARDYSAMGEHWVVCVNCDSSGAMFGEQKQAAEAWNARSYPEEKRIPARCYTKRPCNYAVRCPETGEVVKDIRAEAVRHG